MATSGKPATDTKENSLAGKLVVAAIDFGTTFTGFAYSFRSEPNVISTSKWSGENIRSATEKAPTCVLLSPEKEVIAFGYEAEEKYATLIEDDKEQEVSRAKEYFLFERFKMKLYQTKKLNRETKIADINGKEMLALDVFAKVIGYLKERLEKVIAQSSTGLQDDEILWVMTVLAIWSDSAKQFMREAAAKAGIPLECIRLVLEPEAGSLYCNTKHLCKIVRIDGSTDFEEFPEGQKYIVADLGGGTADISVHEIIENRNLREIYRSDGGPYGGAMVDMKFLSFLIEIFGEKLIKYITEHFYDKFLDLRHQFETKKHTFKPEDTNPVRIKIPIGDLKEAAEATGEDSIENKIKRACENKGNTISLKADKLCIAHELFASFFNEAAEGIVKLIENIRKEDEVGEINAMLMVGGFSESEYLRSIIMRDIPGLRIVVPPDPSLSILKGAIQSGHNPKTITERIARYTYEFSFGKPFQRGKDPEKLKYVQHGREYCSSVFDKKITKGDALKVGDCFKSAATHSCTNLFSLFLPLEVELYRSDEKDPKYTAEGYGCELAGWMFLFPPLTGWAPFSIIVQALVVGESEFTVLGLDLATDRAVAGTLDFLK